MYASGENRTRTAALPLLRSAINLRKPVNSDFSIAYAEKQNKKLSQNLPQLLICIYSVVFVNELS